MKNPASWRIGHSWFYLESTCLVCLGHRNITIVYKPAAGPTHVKRDLAAAKPIEGFVQLLILQYRGNVHMLTKVPYGSRAMVV